MVILAFLILFVFVLFETSTENEVCVRERHFHYWWAHDREVSREPESGYRALLPCPIAHARRHARAVSRACATAARTAKSFPAVNAPHEHNTAPIDDRDSRVYEKDAQVLCSHISVSEKHLDQDSDVLAGTLGRPATPGISALF